MDLGGRKYLSKEERVELIRDLQFVNEEFFKAIHDQAEDDKIHHLKHYMKALENVKNIDSRAWVKTVFNAVIKQIKIYLNKVKFCVSDGDFKEALKLISELTLPVEQASCLSDGNADDRQVEEAKRDVNKYAQIILGNAGAPVCHELHSFERGPG